MKKVLIAFLLIFALGSAGSIIHAGTSPSKVLSNWYMEEFGRKSEQLGSRTVKHLVAGLSDFNRFTHESQSKISNVILTWGAEETGKTQTEIKEKQSEMINSLNETFSGLQQENFDNYTENLTIENDIILEVEQMLEDILNP